MVTLKVGNLHHPWGFRSADLAVRAAASGALETECQNGTKDATV